MLSFLELCQAQPTGSGLPQRIGFVFKKEQQTRFRLKFKQYNNLIILPLKINQSDTLNFVLDTGVGYTLITDPQLVKKQKLPLYREIRITGSNGQEDLIAYISSAERIVLGDIIAEKQGILVLKEEVSGLSEYAGLPIHGLIGYDLMSRFIVQLNYQTQELIFFASHKYKYPKLEKSRYQLLKLDIRNLKPHIEATIELENGCTLPVSLLVDTGAGHSLALERDNEPRISLPKKTIHLPLGMSLTGRIEGEVGRIKRLQIAQFYFQEVITFFPDSAQTAQMRNKTLAQRNGSIGCNLLSRFLIVFDYPRQQLLLKPNSNYKLPFEYNLSGMEIIAEKPDYHRYAIAYVYPNSAAQQAGLKAGDKIIAIDKQLAQNLKISEIYNLLNKKAGKKVVLIVQRNELLLLFELRLKAPI
ncbi:MAG: aspartyl protease family protein [Microscillaceae bacterium]|nr:aspartyl protease family protein [Microscillaceae bacterium]MDW8459957.1 aspartyl protease family protein [Cytophagales bacterium]